METFKKFILVCVFVLVGAGFVAVAECVIPMAIGDDLHKSSNVTAIDEVFLEDEYILNQPLSVEGAKMRIQLTGDEPTYEYVAVKAENVSNFSTAKVGNFEMVILYGSCSYTLPYSVSYKKVDVGNQKFDFEKDYQINLKNYNFYCYDFYDLKAKTISLEEAKVSNIDVSKITDSAVATVEYQDFSFEFDYSVSYFSSTANYVGSCQVDDEFYQVMEFCPALDGKIKISKKILSSNLIEKIFEFDLKRMDFEGFSRFLSAKTVGNLTYDKTLTFGRDVLGNAQEISMTIYQGDKVALDEPFINKIVDVKNLKKNYLAGETPQVLNVVAVLQMSDNSLREVEIDSLNITNLSTNEVGNFSAKINYFNFAYNFAYTVSYKSIDFYFYSSPLDQPFEFSVGSGEIWNFSIICYDINDTCVGYRKISDDDVLLSGFDVSSKTEGQVRKAVVKCFGASVVFEYIVV